MTLDEAIAIMEDPTKHTMTCSQGELTAWLKDLKEAKRLLNLALQNLNNGTCLKFCATCTKVNKHECQDYKRKSYYWIHTEEAMKLLREQEVNTND